MEQRKGRYCDAKIRRLERGTFELPGVAASGEAKGAELKLSELALILEGIEFGSVKRRKRWSASAVAR